MDTSIWFWILFNVFILGMLTLDLFVFHRHSHTVGVKESLLFSGAWISLALMFNVAIVFTHGTEAALNFLAGYLIEKSLSIDNLFVFMLIFTYFKPPSNCQHKILFWGILGAIIMRAIFIFAGIALVSRLHWMLYVFGIILIIMAIKLALEKDKTIEIENNAILKFFRKFIPTTDNYVGDKFFVKRAGRYLATPLALVLIVIETTDILFAIDSIPAIFAITLDPFIIYTSNIFAILGLRSLFFALSGIMSLFHYLHYGLAIILGFTGFKLLTADLIDIPITFTLGFIIFVLLGSILLSYIRPAKITVWAIFFLSLGLTQQLEAASIQTIPVLYQGRFRPLDAASRLWLYQSYHAQSIQQSDLSRFHLQRGHASELLLQLNLYGHTLWDDAPFFWIGQASLKELLELNPTDSRFSYLQLQQALEKDPRTNNNAVTKLITYHALNAYLDPSNHRGSQKLELTKLTPGLWIMFQGDDLILGATPIASPWHFLKKGQLIAKGVLTDARTQMASTKQISDEMTFLLQNMSQYASWQGSALPEEQLLKSSLAQMQERGIPPSDIAQALETQYPLRQRLIHAGSLIKALPGKFQPGEWFSLLALKVTVYHPQYDRLLPVGNFTPYSDQQFNEIRDSYLQWEKDPSEEKLAALAHTLHTAYQSLAGTSYTKAMGKELTYPTTRQLQIESVYYHYPWIWGVIILYTFACLCWLLSLNRTGTAFLIAAFTLHTLVLAARCFILQRPPVSNMFETVIYVPWIGVVVSFFLKERLAILSAALASIILLIILQLTDLNSSLDNVQAVLDSQFWLIIHVLMVVGSYGVFLLSSILGHFYLGSFLYHKEETPMMRTVFNLILQTLYLGTALLITGTILGGVWAAESWGRFWDWDPKESWAFISASAYVIFIHAFRFHKIHRFGLALGSVVGFLAISFTWYGVNYILGTGLHSYGFGSGGEGFYYLFLAIEAAFVAFVLNAKIQFNSPLRQ